MSAAAKPSRQGLIALLALATAEVALATFQWIELYIVRQGGESICAINATFNCESVWTSPAANAIHRAIGMPVAGLGLAWGLAAFALALIVTRKTTANQPAESQTWALRTLAWAGFAACVGFGVVSLRLGHWCLTCLGTYALVLAFLIVAIRTLPGAAPKERLASALMWLVAPPFVAYVVLLLPGSMTPHEAPGAEALANAPAHPSAAPSSEPAADTAASDEVSRFVSSLPPDAQQMLSDALGAYRNGPTATPQLPRERRGPSDAPLRIVEWTDILCPHCRMLLQTMKQLEAALPPGRLSIEPRQFPLDSECNAAMPRSDGTHVRCVAAKAQICLEGAPDYWDLREKMFDAQQGLTSDRALEIAASGSVSREKLDACIASAETADKLKADIDYAMQVHPDGTPIVLINGHIGSPLPPFLYVIGLTAGHVDVPALASLPPPQKHPEL